MRMLTDGVNAADREDIQQMDIAEMLLKSMETQS